MDTGRLFLFWHAFCLGTNLKTSQKSIGRMTRRCKSLYHGREDLHWHHVGWILLQELHAARLRRTCFARCATVQ